MLVKIFIGLFLFAITADPPKDLALPEHMILGCKILNSKGHVTNRYPGHICQFYEDGSLVAVQWTRGHLLHYDSGMNEIWSLDCHCHHQVNKSLNEKELLVLDSSFHIYKGKKTRFDKLRIVDLKGNVKKSFDFYDHREELIQRYPHSGHPPIIDAKIPNFAVQDDRKKTKDAEEKNKTASRSNSKSPKTLPEFSHANSFYEIGPNANEKKIPAFQAGNYIVNINTMELIIILDANLKKILWSMPQPQSGAKWSAAHDVQVLKNGDLLIYANSAPGSHGMHSSIEHYNPISKKYTTVYKHKNPGNFFCNRSGGVQQLNENQYLISDITNEHGRVHVVKKPNQILHSFDNPQKNKQGKPKPFQQIKAEDLSSFLQNNQVL